MRIGEMHFHWVLPLTHLPSLWSQQEMHFLRPLPPSYPPCLFPLSSPGVPSPLSVRPVWRQYVKPSWQPTAPLSASNPQLPAPLVPSPACWSSLPVGWASAAVTPSSEPLDGTLDPPAYISWFSMSVPNNPLFNFRGEALFFFNILIYFLFFNMPSILFYFSPVDFKCLRFLSHSGREMVSKRDGDRFRGLLLLQCKEFCLGLFIDL